MDRTSTQRGNRPATALLVRRWPERRPLVLGVAAGLSGLAAALAPGSTVALAALTALAALPVVLAALELGAIVGIATGALAFGVVAWHAGAREVSPGALDLVTIGVALLGLGAVAGRFSDRMRTLRKRHEHVLESGLRLGRPSRNGSLAGRVAEAAMLVADADGALVTIDDEPPVGVGTLGGPSIILPLRAGKLRVGRLELFNSSELGAEDCAALELVALQAAMARGNQLAVIREGERARAEGELRLAQQLLRERRSEVDYLLASQEDERCRIATHLHDEFAQVLAVVLMGLRLLSRRDSVHGGDAFADVRAQVTSVLEDMRALAVELRSPALTQLGLVPALESLARDLRERGDADIVVHAEELPGPIPDAVATAAYRIVEEALRVSQDAATTPVLRIRVSPRGHGQLGLELELPHVKAEPSLAGIRARVNTAGGSLGAQANGQPGTSLRVVLPLREVARATSAA